MKKRSSPCKYCGGEGVIRYVPRSVEDRPVCRSLGRDHPADPVINESIEVPCSMCQPPPLPEAPDENGKEER